MLCANLNKMTCLTCIVNWINKIHVYKADIHALAKTIMHPVTIIRAPHKSYHPATRHKLGLAAGLLHNVNLTVVMLSSATFALTCSINRFSGTLWCSVTLNRVRGRSRLVEYIGRTVRSRLRESSISRRESWWPPFVHVYSRQNSTRLARRSEDLRKPTASWTTAGRTFHNYLLRILSPSTGQVRYPTYLRHHLYHNRLRNIIVAL